MNLALEAAGQARSRGNLSIAAVLAWADGTKLVEHDTRYTDHHPLSYAILNVINKAVETLGGKKISEAVLYSTVEPDLLCAFAIKAAGIKEVVYGVQDEKNGFISSKLIDNTLLEITAIGNVLGKECHESLPKSIQEYTKYVNT